MNVREFISNNHDLITIVRENKIYGIVEHISMFDEYVDMKTKGEKITYIIAVLSEKYKITERNIFRIIKRMQEKIK